MIRLKTYFLVIISNFKVAFLLFNISLLFFYVLPRFLVEFKHPFTYQENISVNPESLNYIDFSEVPANLTYKFTPELNYLGAVYLYFKPMNYFDCKVWLQNNAIVNGLKPASGWVGSLSDLDISEENIGDEQEYENEKLSCEQNYRFNVLLTVREEGSAEYILQNTFEIYHDKPEVLSFPFGFPRQSTSKGKNYVVEVSPIVSEENEISFMGVAVENGQLIGAPYYHLPLSLAGQFSSDAVSILHSKVLRFATQYFLVLILFLVNLYLLYNSFPDKYYKVLIYNSLFFLILLTTVEYLDETLLPIIDTARYYLILFVLSNLILWLIRSFSLQEKEPIRLTFVILLILVLTVEFLILFEIGKQNFLNSISTIAQMLLGGVAIYFTFRLKDKRIRKNFENAHKLMGEMSTKWILLILVLLSFVLRFYNLGVQSFKEDEFQVVSAAKGYMETGDFLRWDWVRDEPYCDRGSEDCTYTRAWPHTFLIAQVYRFFGVNELSSRLVSAVFGVLLVMCVYWVFKYFTNNGLVSVVGAFAFCFFPSFISISRYTRMYALLTPFYLLLATVGYRMLYEKNPIKFKNKVVKNLISRYLNINLPLVLPFLALLLLTYSIHINSLIILPTLFLFVCYLYVQKKEKHYLVIIAIGLISLIIIYIASFFIRIPGDNYLSFFSRRNFQYLKYMFDFPFPPLVSIAFALAPALVFFRNKKYVLRDKTAFIYISLLFGVLFFVLIADRYAGFMYISHLIPFSVLLIIFGYWIVLSSLKAKTFIMLLGLFLVTVIANLSSVTKIIYTTNNGYGNYRSAYQVILNNLDEGDVIFAQYPRDYYLDNLPSKTKIFNMGANQSYSLDEFKKELEGHVGGWITWETRKGYHLNDDLKRYLEENFLKVAGDGVDEDGVEIYRFQANI